MSVKRPFKRSDTFYFGQYQGKTVQFVLSSDPQYLKWLSGQGTKFEPEIEKLLIKTPKNR
jgi:aspartate oxidase